jgi:putative ABC transport system permease protein
MAAARYGNSLDYAGPNLATNQLAVYTPNGPGYTPPGAGTTITASQLLAMSNRAHEIASSLGARDVVVLESTSASLSHDAPGRSWVGAIYVATPALLHAFGIEASQIHPTTDVLTMRHGISTLSKMELSYGDVGQTIAPGRARGAGPPVGVAALGGRSGSVHNPVIQEVGALPSGTSAPNTVITEHAVQQLGLQTTTSGWLIQTAHSLSASQINSARLAAATAGLTIETKNDEPTSSQVINWATAFGVALALAILAMSVGLLRSETASDLRTLTAAGASRRTRRTLTAATSGALGFLGAVLGTVGGYIGVIGWIRDNSLNGGISSLGHVPVENLLLILVGMPLAAAAVGWLLAWREPAGIAHQPLE